jgi:hypothetical protein
LRAVFFAAFLAVAFPVARFDATRAT